MPVLYLSNPINILQFAENKAIEFINTKNKIKYYVFYIDYCKSDFFFAT